LSLLCIFHHNQSLSNTVMICYKFYYISFI